LVKKVDRAQNLTDIAITRVIAGNSRKLDQYLERFKRQTAWQLENEKHRIDLAGQKAMLSDPGNILKKGYSITTCQGKLVKDLTQLKNEEIIKTRFFKGSVLSKIVEINKSDKNDN